LIALVVAGLFFLSHLIGLSRFIGLKKLPICGALFSPAKNYVSLAFCILFLSAPNVFAMVGFFGC